MTLRIRSLTLVAVLATLAATSAFASPQFLRRPDVHGDAAWTGRSITSARSFAWANLRASTS